MLSLSSISYIHMDGGYTFRLSTQWQQNTLPFRVMGTA